MPTQSERSIDIVALKRLRDECAEHGRSDDEENLSAIIDRLTAAEKPPQDEPDEVGEIEKRNVDRWSRLDGDDPYTLSMASSDLQSSMRDCEALIRLLKHRPASTRTVIGKLLVHHLRIVPFEEGHGVAGVDDFLDAILASGVIRELPTEESIKSALRSAQNTIDGLYPGAAVDRGARTDLQIRTDAVLRLINGEG